MVSISHKSVVLNMEDTVNQSTLVKLSIFTKEVHYLCQLERCASFHSISYAADFIAFATRLV
jgi:hypothetical protein